MDTTLFTPSASILHKVFGWMCAGLIISALTAYWVAGTPAAVDFIVGNQAVFFGLIIIELILVISLSWLIRRISSRSAMALFLIYSIANGLTLSVIVLAFTDASLALTFFVAAGMFGAMALYGFLTRRDLSKLGSFLLMGLFGLIIAYLVNMFVRSDAFDMVASIVGVIIFTGLTAYDIQKIKNLEATVSDEETRAKFAIYGALMLYLDFINLFLSLLRFTGRRRS